MQNRQAPNTAPDTGDSCYIDKPSKTLRLVCAKSETASPSCKLRFAEQAISLLDSLFSAYQPLLLEASVPCAMPVRYDMAGYNMQQASLCDALKPRVANHENAGGEDK